VPEPTKLPQDLRATRTPVAPQFSCEGGRVPARLSTVARQQRRDASHLSAMVRSAPSRSLILKLGRSTDSLWSPSGTARSSCLLRAGTGVAASSPVRPRLQFADEHCSIESRRGWEARGPLSIRGPLRRSAEQPRAVPFLPEGPPREQVPTEAHSERTPLQPQVLSVLWRRSVRNASDDSVCCGRTRGDL
jgi:hypothetical protein